MLHQKKILGVSLLLLSVLFCTALSAAQTTLFSDNFEGTLADVTAHWEINDYYVINNTDDVYLQKSADGTNQFIVVRQDSNITTTVSTKGQENIVVRYDRRTKDTKSGDFLRVMWRAGTGGRWIALEDLNQDIEWKTRIFELPIEADNQDAIQVRFFLEDGNKNRGYIDNFAVLGDAVVVEPNNTDVDTGAPFCSIDSAINIDSDNAYDFADSLYLGETGTYLVYGSAEDAQTDIDAVQYNRTSPDGKVISWANAEGTFNNPTETWATHHDDKPFVEGSHQICCIATDDSKNTGAASCQSFCIDTQDPGVVSEILLTDQEMCTEGYTNDYPGFTWTAPESNGCAPIDHYEVEIQDSVTEDEQTSSITLEDETLDATADWTIGSAQNGHAYSLRVRAVDASGNTGEWSEWTDSVTYDNEDPTVEITEVAGTNVEFEGTLWFTDKVVVSEIDSDNINLASCQYALEHEGEMTQNWTDTICNEDITLDLVSACPVDGECTVLKKATDLACNEAGIESFSFMTDTHAPNTTLEVGELKYPGKWLLGWLIEWFVTDTTEVSFTCTDEGVGECTTYYRLMKENAQWSEWTAYDGYSFTLNEGDGLYTIEYYSVDLLNHTESVKTSNDRVDMTPPVSLKEESPLYIDAEGTKWVGANTLFTISATDSETGVGVNRSWYSINGGESVVYTEPFNLSSLCTDYYDENQLVDIAYGSVDQLENNEEAQYQNVTLDCEAPTFIVLNPTIDEASNITLCTQAIVLNITSEDERGIKRVWAELSDGESVVRSVQLHNRSDGAYESFMDKQLVAGTYTLSMYAEDYVGNVYTVSQEEVLQEGITVQTISPAVCSITLADGGSCDFTYNVCMRGGNAVKMWMDKLGGVVPPGLMDASISHGEDTVYVGYKNASGPLTSPVGNSLLVLSNETVNGIASFTLHLNLDANVTSSIGTGSHVLDYLINGYSYP